MTREERRRRIVFSISLTPLLLPPNTRKHPLNQVKLLYISHYIFSFRFTYLSLRLCCRRCCYVMIVFFSLFLFFFSFYHRYMLLNLYCTLQCCISCFSSLCSPAHFFYCIVYSLDTLKLHTQNTCTHALIHTRNYSHTHTHTLINRRSLKTT